MAVPIGGMFATDKLIWHFSSTGQFTAKSCYHALLTHRTFSRGMESGGAASSSGESTRRWKFIWKLSIPPKVRIFLWRACSDILPTNVELFRRGISPSPFCRYCPDKCETTQHVLQFCHGMQAVWNSPPFNLPNMVTFPSFWSCLVYLRENLEQGLFLLATIVIWKTWDLRNRRLHGNEQNGNQGVVSWSGAFLHSFNSAIMSAHQPPTRAFSTTWSPSSDPRYCQD
ncbi:PREDICTED: uncharacterized protein LOC105972213 [Erythranthe guttata]|uniref:uncharacterized protein LOC105972213 n=1 Tax=Erythranthe guttata TaxID=4155 RepID=UPI00064DDBF9|nr:PREDICTED: uncharacterized protein LOC105972213 [Erythranthe guttata]|eukprot:XP_012852602.1 PREDICTED: uncharacterized protein LOC105972213 [Erythranthe guttata]